APTAPAPTGAERLGYEQRLPEREAVPAAGIAATTGEVVGRSGGVARIALHGPAGRGELLGFGQLRRLRLDDRWQFRARIQAQRPACGLGRLQALEQAAP